MGDSQNNGSGPLSGSRMTPWTGDEASRIAFGRAMAERGVSINHNDNCGVTPEVADMVARSMADSLNQSDESDNLTIGVDLLYSGRT